MKKNSTLNKKLKSYSALAGTFVAAATTADAQVVYTDVIPDATVASGATYDLDLNNDGTADFQFQMAAGTYSGTFYYVPITVPYKIAMIVPMAGNAIDTLAGGAKAHAAGEILNSASGWEDDSGAPYQLLGVEATGFYSGGNFLAQSDKFLGLRFKISGVDHYGWARIDLSADASSMTLKDYAYDGTATSIITGATTTGIDESQALANAVTVFAADNTITVNMHNAAPEGVVIVTNTLGQEIANMNITDALMHIPVNGASTGIYFVTVNQANAKFTKKVIIR